VSKIAQGAIDKAIIAAHECTNQALTTELEETREAKAQEVAMRCEAEAQAKVRVTRLTRLTPPVERWTGCQWSMLP
jgi:hypothetical protein